MIQLQICPSDGHWLFTTFLRLGASFMITPRASSRSSQISNSGFEAQTQKLSLVVLRPKPPNNLEKRIYYTSMISTRVTVVFDRPITKSFSTSA